MLKYLSLLIVTISFLTLSHSAASLTASEFIEICDSMGTECTENPILQAYVGGALDMIAALDEETTYLEGIVCKDKKTLFNVSRIIQFMQKNSDQYAAQNAMRRLIHYLEDNGGCKQPTNQLPLP